jgi:TRAP-type C4-dicarboxylate transport system permease small subunit
VIPPQHAESPAGGARWVLQALDRLATGMAYVSGAVFLLVSFYITLDVIGRKFLGVSTAVSDEFGGYALAVGGMWALAYTLRQGAHVRIDVLLPHLPDRLRALLNYAALAMMTLFAAVVTLYVWRLSLDSLAIDARAMSFLRTPLVVPQGLMAVGFSVLTLEGIVILLVGVVESVGRGALAPLEGLEAGAPIEEVR